MDCQRVDVVKVLSRDGDGRPTEDDLVASVWVPITYLREDVLARWKGDYLSPTWDFAFRVDGCDPAGQQEMPRGYERQTFPRS